MAKVQILRITAKRDGRRRAGLDHPAAPVDHPADTFTPDQIAQLKADDQLVVQEVEVDVPDDKAGEKPEPAGKGGKAAG